jgi:hypothetical protein
MKNVNGVLFAAGISASAFINRQKKSARVSLTIVVPDCTDKLEEQLTANVVIDVYQATSHLQSVSISRTDGPKVTLPNKIEYLRNGSSKLADFFTSNKGMFTLHIHKDKGRENLS